MRVGASPPGAGGVWVRRTGCDSERLALGADAAGPAGVNAVRSAVAGWASVWPRSARSVRREASARY